MLLGIFSRLAGTGPPLCVAEHGLVNPWLPAPVILNTVQVSWEQGRDDGERGLLGCLASREKGTCATAGGYRPFVCVAAFRLNNLKAPSSLPTETSSMRGEGRQGQRIRSACLGIPPVVGSNENDGARTRNLRRDRPVL